MRVAKYKFDIGDESPMETLTPSRTAQGAAMHRAAHQLFDTPPLFIDPLAVRIIGPEAEEELREGTDWHARDKAGGLRAFIAMRSRFAEDGLASAVARGVRQYVLLGAGLDTFAYRASDDFSGVTIFEIDHPATQAWKRARLEEFAIPIPSNVIYAPVNFESETLREGLARAGFDFSRPAFFAWLGVTPYLSRDTVMATLKFIVTSMAAGSEIVFDYAQPVEAHDAVQRASFEAMAERVAAAGEPFKSFFEPAELTRELCAMGYSAVDDFDATALNPRYFANRADGLKLRGRAHVLKARV
jgi:methyltransferase (TIGR00027 family)